jgi:hypothetical protein
VVLGFGEITGEAWIGGWRILVQQAQILLRFSQKEEAEGHGQQAGRM